MADDFDFSQPGGQVYGPVPPSGSSFGRLAPSFLAGLPSLTYGAAISVGDMTPPSIAQARRRLASQYAGWRPIAPPSLQADSELVGREVLARVRSSQLDPSGFALLPSVLLGIVAAPDLPRRKAGQILARPETDFERLMRQRVGGAPPSELERLMAKQSSRSAVGRAAAEGRRLFGDLLRMATKLGKAVGSKAVQKALGGLTGGITDIFIPSELGSGLPTDAEIDAAVRRAQDMGQGDGGGAGIGDVFKAEPRASSKPRRQTSDAPDSLPPGITLPTAKQDPQRKTLPSPAPLPSPVYTPAPVSRPAPNPARQNMSLTIGLGLPSIQFARQPRTTAQPATTANVRPGDEPLTRAQPAVLASPSGPPGPQNSYCESLKRSKRKKKRKCLERANIAWTSGRRKGRLAGTKCLKWEK